MQTPNFFELSRYPSGKYLAGMSKAPGYRQGDATKCPKCGAFVSMLAWLPPFRVELELTGEQLGDLIFSPGNDFLASKRFCEAYQGLKLIGLTGFDPVEVVRIQSRRKSLPEAPPYFRVEPLRTEAALDLMASGCEWVEPPKCDYCRTGQLKRRTRLVLEKGTWSGEDIFCPRGATGRILTTDRFKNACEQHGITNAEFIPAACAGVDFYPDESPRAPGQNGSAG